MWTANQNPGRARASASQTILLAIFVLSTPLHAADVGSVRGVVTDPQDRPIVQADIQLKSKTSDWVQTTATGKRGEFVFPTVPLGDYVLSAAKTDFASVAQGVTVGSGSSPTARLQLVPGSALAAVTVTAQAETTILNTATPTTLVNREDI